MEDQQSNTTPSEYTGTTTFFPPEQATRQVGPFPGSAKRLRTENQSPVRESDGHQAVGNIRPVQDAALPDNVVTGEMNCSPGASGQGIEKEWPHLFHEDILNPQDTEHESYFLEKCELKSLTERECLAEIKTQIINRDGLDTKIVLEGSSFDEETTDDDSYFLAESELQLHSLSNQAKRKLPNETELPPKKFAYSSIRMSKRGTKQKQTVREGSEERADGYWRQSYVKNGDNTSDLSFLEQGVSEPKRPRRHQTATTKVEPTQALVHSSIRQSKSRAKRHISTPVQSSEVDGEYWRRSYADNDDIISEQSSLEQGLHEPKRQWYRSKNTRPKNICSLSRRNPVNCGFIWSMFVVIMFLVFIIFFSSTWYIALTNPSGL